MSLSNQLLISDNNESGTMEIGDCFTIEPSLVHGSNSRGFIWDDGWTMSTEVCHGLVGLAADRSLVRGVLNSSIRCSSLRTGRKSSLDSICRIAI